MTAMGEQENTRQAMWDAYLARCPRCDACAEPIPEPPYLRYGRLILCPGCVCRFTVDTEEI